MSSIVDSTENFLASIDPVDPVAVVKVSEAIDSHMICSNVNNLHEMTAEIQNMPIPLQENVTSQQSSSLNESIISLESDIPDSSVRLTSTPKKRRRVKQSGPRKRNKSSLTLEDYSIKLRVGKPSYSVTVLGNEVPVFVMTKNVTVDSDIDDVSIRYYLWKSVIVCIPQIHKEHSNQGFTYILPTVLDFLDKESFIASGRDRWIREDVLFALLGNRTRFTESEMKKAAALEDLKAVFKKPTPRLPKSQLPPPTIFDVSIIEKDISDELNQDRTMNTETSHLQMNNEHPDIGDMSSIHASHSPKHMSLIKNGVPVECDSARHPCSSSFSQDMHFSDQRSMDKSSSADLNLQLSLESSDSLHLYRGACNDSVDSSSAHNSSFSHDSQFSDERSRDKSSSADLNLQLSVESSNSFDIHLNASDDSVDSPVVLSSTEHPKYDDTPDKTFPISASDASVEYPLAPSTIPIRTGSTPVEVSSNSCDADSLIPKLDTSSSSKLPLNHISASENSVEIQYTQLTPVDLDVSSQSHGDAGIDIVETGIEIPPPPVDCVFSSTSPLNETITSTSSSVTPNESIADIDLSINAEKKFDKILSELADDSRLLNLSSQSSSEQPSKPVNASTDIGNIPGGSFTFWGRKLEFLLKDKLVYLPTDILLEKCKLADHVYSQKNGFRRIEAAILKNVPGIDPEKSFIYDVKGKRTHMSVLTLIRLLPHIKFGDKSMILDLQELLLAIIDSQTYHKTKTRKSFTFSDFLDNNTKDQACKQMSARLLPGKSERTTLNAEDVIKFLLMKETLSRKAIIEKIIVALMQAVNPISAIDMIYIAENYKGQKLLDELHKLMGLVLPSRAEERESRKMIDKYFSATMLPERISTGDHINFSRLVELLALAYPEITHPEQIGDFLNDDLELKVKFNSKLLLRGTGDGFNFGGQPATFTGASVQNDEIEDHQSRTHCYPISLFLGSDTRNNLVQNLTKPYNRLASSMEGDATKSLCELYASSDEKFFINQLDDDGVLSSASKDHYNPYGHTDSSYKDVVAWPSGKRTDLKPIFDREHPNKIFPVDVKRTPFDEMHLATRTIEKSINLELQMCLSEGNKRDVLRANDKSILSGEDLVANFANNVTKKGITRHILYWEDDGKTLRPISLSNTAAMGILAPSTTSAPSQCTQVSEIGIIAVTEDDDSHVLHNVVSRRIVVLQGRFKESVRIELKLPSAMTEYDLVKLLWESLYHLLIVLRTEPDDACRGINGAPYSFEVLQNFQFHAERFYQLFCVRYNGASRMTPYQIKLVDYSHFFMITLPVPLNRYSTQGSENFNHEMSRFCHEHTTTFGGHEKSKRPTREVLRNSFFKLYYKIVVKNPCKTDEQKLAKKKFLNLIQRHLRSTTVNKMIKGWLVRERMNRVSGTKWERAAKSCVDPTPNQAMVEPSPGPLEDRPDHKIFTTDVTFVTAGRVTSMKMADLVHAEKFAGIDAMTLAPNDKKKQATPQVTQDRVESLLRELGARVVDKIPKDDSKCAKRPHVVLCDTAEKGHINPDVKKAHTQNHPVVTFNYVTECVLKQTVVPYDRFQVSLSQLTKLTKYCSNVHRRSGTSEHSRNLKKRREEKKMRKKKDTKKRSKPPKFIRNVAVFYATKKRASLVKGRKKSIQVHRDLLGRFMKEWVKMRRSDPVRRAAARAYQQYRKQYILKYASLPANRKVRWINKMKGVP